MTIQHQTWSPNTCSCVIEQQFDDEHLDRDPELLFFHNVCEKHEPLVADKPKLKMQDWDSKRKQILSHKENLLRQNRIRHLNTFEAHPERQNKFVLANDPASKKYSERMIHELEEDRRRQEVFLDNHEQKAMERLLVGTYSRYAFLAKDVYDAIIKEQREINAK